MRCVELFIDYYKYKPVQGLYLSGEKDENSESYAVDYVFGFNGMEQDNEVRGQGNSLDFGARIYDSRLGRFLTVDPLATALPNYSSYLFAGNKPIAFVDKDGKMEKIVIYSKNNEGKTVMTTYTKDGVTIKTEGNAAIVHKDLSSSWADFNNAQYEVYKNQEGLFKGKGPESGYGKFKTQGGMLDRGTLYVNAMGNEKNVLWYESTTTPKKRSMAGIIYENVVENPDYRQKKFNSTVKNYVAGVTAPITLGLTLEAATTLELVGGLASLTNTLDDASGLMYDDLGENGTMITNLAGEKTGSIIKTGLSAAGVAGGVKGFSDNPVGSAITITADVISTASSANQCVDTCDSNIEYMTPPSDDD